MAQRVERQSVGTSAVPAAPAALWGFCVSCPYFSYCFFCFVFFWNSHCSWKIFSTQLKGCVSWHTQEPRDELWQQRGQVLLLMRFLCCWMHYTGRGWSPGRHIPSWHEQPTSCFRYWLWGYQQLNLLCVHRAKFLPLQ